MDLWCHPGLHLSEVHFGHLNLGTVSQSELRSKRLKDTRHCRWPQKPVGEMGTGWGGGGGAGTYGSRRNLGVPQSGGSRWLPARHCNHPSGYHPEGLARKYVVLQRRTTIKHCPCCPGLLGFKKKTRHIQGWGLKIPVWSALPNMRWSNPSFRKMIHNDNTHEWSATAQDRLYVVTRFRLHKFFKS